MQIENCLNGYVLKISDEIKIILSPEMFEELRSLFPATAPDQPLSARELQKKSRKKTNAYGWGAKYKSCMVCGTTAKEHQGGGLCSTCYWAKYKNKKNSPEIKNNDGKKWSLKYDKCVMCGTTEKPHKANGFCRGCWTPRRAEVYLAGGDPKTVKRGKSGNNGIGKGGSKWSRLHKNNNNDPIAGSCANVLICLDCEEEFTSVLDKLDAVCPACNGINIDNKFDKKESI
jgi:hypothetical protein